VRDCLPTLTVSRSTRTEICGRPTSTTKRRCWECRQRAFDRPTGVAVAPNGDIFVTDGHYPNVVIGSARDGSLKAFIPDPYDITKLERGSSASGIVADETGTVYAADVAAHNLRKYIKVR